MQIHSLRLDDFCDDEYSLIGVHTILEDYKLAYWLNKQLKTKLIRASNDLDLKSKNYTASFSTYTYYNQKYDYEWCLLANSFIQNTDTEHNNLLFSSEIKVYLIPEKKNIDFFIKIIGKCNYKFIDKTLKHINTIPGVITSYSVDVKTLKSKNYLTF